MSHPFTFPFLWPKRKAAEALPAEADKAIPTPVSSNAIPLSTITGSSFMSSHVASWINLTQLIYMMRCYYENPIVNAVINAKADAHGNMKYKVKVLKDDDEIPLEDFDLDGGKLKNLLQDPNPLQSGEEFNKQFSVNYDVFGEAYVYASIPLGFKNWNWTDVNVLNNLPPYCMSHQLSGMWLDATEKEEIIKEYKMRVFNGKTRDFEPGHVMHLNNVNITLDRNFVNGKSKLLGLQKPISNIDLAYESRNVLIKKRGAIGAWTSEKKDDAMGSLPMSDKEIKIAQEAFSKYGLLEDQYAQVISPMPLKYQKTAMSVKELMLFEEVSTNAIAVCNAFGVPEDYARWYIKTGGLAKENNNSTKRLYDATIIPEAVSRVRGINNWLKLGDAGYQLIPSFDHLNVLQTNKKEAAETLHKREQAHLSALKVGAITFGQYCSALGFPVDPSIENLRIWELTPEQLNALGITLNSRNNEGQSSQNSGSGQEDD